MTQEGETMEKSFNNVLKDINDLYNTGNTEEAKELLEKESREFCTKGIQGTFWSNGSAGLMEGIVLSMLKGNSKETVSLEGIMNILDQALAEGEFSFENYSKAFGELPTKTRISITLLLRDKILLELKKHAPKVKNKVILGKTGHGKMTRTFAESEFQLQLVPKYVKQLDLIVDEQGKRFVRYVDTYGKEE